MESIAPELTLAASAKMPIAPTARRGILIVISYFLLQLAVSVIGGFFLGVVYAVTGGNPANKAAFRVFFHGWAPVMTLLSLVVSAALVLAWLYRKVESRDDGFSFSFLRLIPIPGREHATAIAIGAGVGVLYIAVTALFGPRKLPTTLGPVSTLSTETGAAFLIWVSLGLLAPFIEEVLFRGVLLQSCLAAWPRPPASTVAATMTGLAFVAVHVGEIVHVPIAATGIGGLAIATTVYAMKRTVTGSIGIHFAYNVIVIASVIASRLASGHAILN